MAQAALLHVRDFLVVQQMPIILLSFIVLGAAWPPVGIAAAATPLSSISVGGIFFLTGLGLNTKALKALATWEALRILLLGLVSILVVSPALSLALARLPLAPIEFALGLALFWAMPTTNTSGVVIVASAGGNVPVAVGLSVISNVIGVFSSPLWVASLFGSAHVSTADLLSRLSYTVLAPLAFGFAARWFKRVRWAVKRLSLALKLTSSILLALVPWMLMSQSSEKLSTLTSASLASLLSAAVLAHIVLLAASAAVFAVIPSKMASSDNRVSITLMSAQKSVTFAAAIAITLPHGPGGVDAGLVMLPSVLGHLAQTLISTALAGWWSRRQVRTDATLAVHDAKALPAIESVVSISINAEEEVADDVTVISKLPRDTLDADDVTTMPSFAI